MGVGMPQELLLHEFGSHVWGAFGVPPYHVGSSVRKKQWRDVDVRLILDDEVWDAMGLGDPDTSHTNAKWVALCLAFSALGKQITGLPIDFQIQKRTHANRIYASRDRSALGLTPHRYEKKISHE